MDKIWASVGFEENTQSPMGEGWLGSFAIEGIALKFPKESARAATRNVLRVLFKFIEESSIRVGARETFLQGNHSQNVGISPHIGRDISFISK